MKQFTLGEICTIIKGSTGIKKSVAGEYPLVVTAEERVSCSEYQFDTKAVCIPLVSSTGHGHASLKRIHYQEGKFALGNILAAVIPNDEEQLSAEYLYYYLTFYKDSKIVPLMKGAANVSLTINSLKTIIVEFPDIDTQYNIVKSIKKIQEKYNVINKISSEQKLIIKNLKKSILLEAVQGKLVPQNFTDEPASELLKRIKAEKEQSIKEGKIKKEKTLPAIAEGEKPYALPQGWEWTRLGEIVDIARGGSPRPIQAFLTTNENGLNWIKIGDTDKGSKYINSAKEKIIKEGLTKTRYVKKGDFLLSNSMSFGRPYILNIDGCIHDGWLVLSNIEKCFDKHFLYYLLSSSFLYIQFCSSVSGAVVKNLNSDKVSNAIICLPPLAEQKRIVEKLERIFKIIEEFDIKNKIIQEKSTNFIQAFIQNSFTDNKRSSNTTIDLKEKRAILSAKIISEMYNEQYFGAIKLEKLLYLCETHLKINLGGNYHKEVAGPHDAQSRYEVESILKNRKWFKANKVTKGNIEVTKYIPLEKSNDISNIFNEIFSTETTKINDFLELFRGKNSDFCESIATLYAVWDNRLNNNLICSDSDLISDFKSWSKQKARFYDSDLRDRILFMKRKHLIPDSNIKK